MFLVLLQDRLSLLGPGLPSSAMPIIQPPYKSILPVINRLPIIANNDDDHDEALVERQAKADKNYDTPRNYNSILTESTVVIE